MIANMFRRRRTLGRLPGAGPRTHADRCLVAVLERLEDRRLLSATIDLAGVLTIEGTAGDDRIAIDAGPGDGQVIVRNAPGVDDDEVFVGVNEIVINSFGGDDKIIAFDAFTDTSGQRIGLVIDAGDGRDKVYTGGGDDVIDLGSGSDRGKDRGGDNVIDAGTGRDRVTTRGGDDDVDLGAGNDVLRTRGGDNTVSGGNGNDNIRTGKGDDTIDAGAGDDVVRIAGGENYVVLGVDDDTFRGGRAGDFVLGGDGDDRIFGGKGNDHLDGGVGDDRIHGDQNRDVLVGGLGADDFDRDRADDVDVDQDDGLDDIIFHGPIPGPNPADTEGDEDGLNDTRTTADAVLFDLDDTLVFGGVSPTRADRDFFRFVAPRSGAARVQLTADQGPAPDLRIQDVFRNNLLRLGSGQIVDQTELIEGRLYYVLVRAPGSIGSDYSVRVDYV